MLVVVILGVADFGRAFIAGMTLDSAARDGAAAAAHQYALIARMGRDLDHSDYLRLHEIARDTVCSETTSLPNHAASGESCALPLTAVCVRDGHDPLCGSEAIGALPQCTELNGAWEDSLPGGPDHGPSVVVEVRTCYRFSTVLSSQKISLPFGLGLGFGDFYLQRNHEFPVAAS